MRLRLLSAAIVVTLLPLAALANEPECTEFQVRQCFVDGSNTTCVCLDAPSDVATNPEPEPDGHVNEG